MQIGKYYPGYFIEIKKEEKMLKCEDLINNTDYVFIDISSEMYRTYIYSDNTFFIINNPIALSVSESGSHRILDADGISHYIPKGYIHLCWKAKDGQPHFVK